MTAKPNKRVVVAMSGGVDSSVAAALLVERGYEVIGCFMRLGTPDGVEQDEQACRLDEPGTKSHKQGCCSVLDAADARLVAAQLGIPLYVVNFRDEFGRIIEYFEEEYHRGRTPNPCVRCNQWLKFGRLADYAASIDADFVATGHYARVDRDEQNRPIIRRGRFVEKDQSYALFGIERRMLDRMMLPIGEYPKPEVRQMAEARGLQVFEKPDSQEICFVPDQDYAGLIRRRQPDRMMPGPLVDTSGKLLGEHHGHQNFTIGQRRGLPVSLGYPIYVVRRDPENNTVIVGQRDDIMGRSLEAGEANWLIDPPADEFACTVKIRYNRKDMPARVQIIDDQNFRVQFDEPQPAITPGQPAVCYLGDRLLGGGWIDRALD